MIVTRTYLELRSPADFHPAFGDFPDLRVARLQAASPALYRDLYRGVGEAYGWRDRWHWSDDEIIRHLAQATVTLFIALEDERTVGWYELQRDDDGSVEIAYFGLFPAFLGRGLGKHLLSHAVRDAWTWSASRLWLHTCTLDHPAALANYLKRGFVPYKKEEYEVDSP